MLVQMLLQHLASAAIRDVCLLCQFAIFDTGNEVVLSFIVQVHSDFWLIVPTSRGLSVGIVRSRTKATELLFVVVYNK
jgi:hypothetical protein